jgi:hypothetical protein
VERDSGGAFSAAGIRLSGPLSLSDDGVADHGTVTINDQIALRMRGTGNVAVGGAAANGSMSGEFNTAVGGWALDANSTGEYNTAMGLRSLTLNTNGVQNTAVGVDALHSNETGDFNTGVGVQALYYTTGNGNIGIGYRAGFEVTVGDNNILIGSKGSSSDHRVIRIGDPTIHSDTFLSGNIRTDGAAIVGGKISSVGDIQRRLQMLFEGLLRPTAALPSGHPAMPGWAGYPGRARHGALKAPQGSVPWNEKAGTAHRGCESCAFRTNGQRQVFLPGDDN